MANDHGIRDQNYMVWNQGKNPLVNFNFMLRVELAFDLPCKSVRAFSRELEYDYIQEGGLNDYVHMRRKPITRPFTLEVERYVGVDYIDPMPLGAELALPVLLFVSRAHDQFIPFVVARTYTFTGCSVIKKTYGDLVADQSGLLVETTTLAYREMLCVDIPSSEHGDHIVAPSKDTTNSSTAEKEKSRLKELGNRMLEKAIAANETAKVDYVEADVDEMVGKIKQASQDLDAALASGGTLAKTLETAEAGLKNEAGKLLEDVAQELRDKLPDVQKARDEAKETLDDAYPAVEETEAVARQARAARKSAEKKLEAAKWELEQATQKKAEAEKAAAKQAQGTKKAGETEDEQAGADVAGTALAQAITQLKEKEEKKKEAELAFTAADGKVIKAEADSKAAAEAHEEAKSAYYQAREDFEKARIAAAAASSAASAAKTAFNMAENLVARGNKRVSELKNMLTNLNSRKTRCAKAQEECDKALPTCRSANEKLQGIDDSKRSEQVSAYNEVRKTAKKVENEQRKTSEIQNYLGLAQKILDDTAELIAPPAEED